MRVNPDPFLKRLCCLYVEDEEYVRKSFTLMLQSYFGKVIVASNGEEGLDLFEKIHPDMVISDIRMPVMDGIIMAQKIKDIDPDAIIIFLTAFSDFEYLKKALEVGVEGYLTKPIDRNVLLKKLNSLAKTIKKHKENQELIEILRTVFEESNEPIALLKNGMLYLANSAFDRIFGDVSNETFDEILKSQQEHIEYRYKKSIFEVFLHKKEEFVILFFLDITDYKQLYIDELTHVYNRKIVDKILPSLLYKPLCVVFGDIDHFKKVNDTFGHQVGDMVLQTFSTTLKKHLRRDDIVIRWGGEEFVILLTNVLDISMAVKIAEHLRKSIEKTPMERVGHITASFGVCCGHIYHRNDIEKMIESADKALYEAKRGGRNRVEVCVE